VQAQVFLAGAPAEISGAGSGGNGGGGGAGGLSLGIGLQRHAAQDRRHQHAERGHAIGITVGAAGSAGGFGTAGASAPASSGHAGNAGTAGVAGQAKPCWHYEMARVHEGVLAVVALLGAPSMA